MLLKQIKASNFMKYRRLEILDVQDRALIGIFGENESGKSTLGEAVSFALFGMTARFKNQPLSQLINWDSEECRVEITFALQENEEYTVMRQIDRQGNHHAALYKGRNDPPIAKGYQTVTQEIEKLTHFSFEDFRYTFYLAQKEIDLILKEKSNTREMLHRMLGFDRINRACDVLKQESEGIQNRKSKCESELLVIQSLIKNIKVDSSVEKNLLKQWEDQKKQRKQIELDVKNIEAQVSRSWEILQTYQEMSKAFQALERSFYYSFHKERLSEAINSLSGVYALLREEKKRVLLSQKKMLEEWDSFQSFSRDAEHFTRLVHEVRLLIQAYHKSIQKRLVFPDKESKTPPKDNLQIALQKEEHWIQKTAKKGVFLLFFSLVSFFVSIHFLFSVLWTSNPKKLLWLDISLQNHAHPGMLLWSVCIFTFLAGLYCMSKVFGYRKAVAGKQEVREKILLEIEQLQKEVEICLNFQSNQISSLRETIFFLSDLSIKQKLEEIEKRFARIFAQYTTLQELEKSLQEQQEKHLARQNNVEKRIGKIENLSKIIEGLARDIDFNLPESEKEQEWLKDLDRMEQRIYELMDTIQKYKAFLHDYENGVPLGIEVCWQEYEKYRGRFKDLASVPSMGGGTGMLSRLQVSYRHKNYEKLVASFQSERENFFSTLPSLESIQEKFNQEKKQQSELNEKLNEGATVINSLEMKYQKCEEELIQKKDLLAKSAGLGKQIQEIEYNLSVNGMAIDMLKHTLASADNRFSPGISKVMSRVLPRLTKERYNHVQVGEDLSIKAYSTEKNDFVNLSELSGGTVDQLFISLRLAFSQAIMAARVGIQGMQFLFFDEPIISFDEQRSYSFFDLLSDYNKNFVQVFVISPRSYNEEVFDLVITTNLSSHELAISGKGTLRKRRVTARHETVGNEPTQKVTMQGKLPEEAIEQQAISAPAQEAEEKKDIPEKNDKERPATRTKRREKRESKETGEEKIEESRVEYDDQNPTFTEDL